MPVTKLDGKGSEEREIFHPESSLDTDHDGMAMDLALDSQRLIEANSDSELEYTTEGYNAIESKGNGSNAENALSSPPVLKRKKTAGIDCGLCQVINNARDHPPTQKINSYKGKVLENTDCGTLPTLSNIKHVKKLEPAGLCKNWRNHIVVPVKTKLAQNGLENNNLYSGKQSLAQASDEEGIQELSAVKNTRLSNNTLLRVHSNDSSKSFDKVTSGVKYCKMPVTCLPLPNGIAGHEELMKWKTQFKATAINFAANLNQPFSANALLHNYVPDWWGLIYDSTMEEHWAFTMDCNDTLPAIVEQA
ncbi:hypothetical protein C0992_003254, partial [Termitomyces sp. T32_za158]